MTRTTARSSGPTTVGQSIIAPPISYRIKGEQYIAVMAGFGGAGALVGKIVPNQPRGNGRLMVFKLGGTARPTPAVAADLPPIDVTGLSSTGNPDIGMAEYDRTCGICHGANASVSYTADLRRSGALRDPAVWKSVVIDGTLKDQGMVGFGQILTPAEAENIRAYVIRQAKKGATGRSKCPVPVQYCHPRESGEPMRARLRLSARGSARIGGRPGQLRRRAVRTAVPAVQFIDFGLAPLQIELARGRVGISGSVVQLVQLLVEFGAMVERADDADRNSIDELGERPANGQWQHEAIQSAAHEIAHGCRSDQGHGTGRARVSRHSTARLSAKPFGRRGRQKGRRFATSNARHHRSWN